MKANSSRSPRAIESALLAYGTRFRGGSDRPIELCDGSVLLVIAGTLDLFAVPVGAGGLRGRRRHLCRVRGSEAVFAPLDRAQEARVDLLAVGVGEVEAVRVPWNLFEARLLSPDLADHLGRLIESWVETVCSAIFSRPVPPPRCVELEIGREEELPRGAAASPGTGVSWLRHESGKSRLLGLEPLRVNGTGWLPLAGRSWLEIAEPSRLRVASTSEVPLADKSTGLQNLHELLLGFASYDIDRQEADERARTKRREEADRKALESACRRLVSTLVQEASGRPSAPLPPDPAHRPETGLERCCRLVADSAGVPFTIEAEPREGDPPTLLRSLARASRFRVRRVALRDDWWQDENGPLLGFRADSGAPVAIIPDSRGGYTLHAYGDSPQPVEPALAESLSPFAFSFYRPFPERPLRLWDVIRFGMHGGRRDLLMLAATGTMTGMLAVVTPIATGVVFNSVIPAADRGNLLQLVLVLVVCATSSAIFQLGRGIAQIRLEGRMGAAVQAAVWDRLLSLPMSFFRPYTAGELAVRAMGIDTIRQTLSGATMTALLGGIFSLANFALLFYYSVRLALWATLLAGTAAAVTLLVSWAQLRYQRQISTYQQEISGQVLQFLGSVAKLQVAGAESHAFAAWARKFANQRALQFRARRIGNSLTAFNVAFPVISTLVIFAAATPLLLQDNATLRTGDFLAFMSAFSIFLSAILSMTSAVVSVLMIVPLYENARPVLETLPEVDGGKTDPGTLSGEIEATHLAFRYDAGAPLILRDLSFHVRAGEFVAFVGPSGTGKSTIFRLLLGFEAPESGAIYFDGQELGGLNTQAVRQQIGVVLQNGRLMPGDIFTNIVGSSSATVEDAWRAARMAGLEDDIRQMPMGMHTVISEGGGTLSGGQRQRLMIARAVVNRPRILLFDEATSALDNRTQAIVSQSLERMQATRIVIAHRLSTIINADRILVFDGGRIVESGTYAELMERRGPFAELAARQLL